ncbi:cd63 antigen [Cichlidogyrus casuarinus]|uniref:Tetraspanin n=1 Tax=Cichlidogyrus casuarinus TaxID=1844966 RepID=A0ABD2PQV2_9PLAT
MAELSCGYKCLKILVGIFNLLAFLAGLIFLIIGAVFYSNVSTSLNLDFNIKPFALIVLILGCIIMVLGFLGCCGAFKEVPCLLITFATLMSIIFVILFAGGVAALVFKKEFTIEKMKEKFTKNEIPGPVEIAFKCCGLEGPSSYPDPNKLPSSCCGRIEATTCTQANSFQIGCRTAISDSFSKILIGIGTAVLILLIIILTAIIMASCLAARIREGETM